MLRILNTPRRTAAVAAVALGGCLSLTACGPVQMGAAAIVGGRRITTSTLTTEVSGLTSYYESHRKKVVLVFPAAQIPQQVLAWLIRFQVRDQMAKAVGISVTPGEIQRAVQEINTQAEQSGQGTLTDLAVANGLPPNLIDSDLGRYQAIETALIDQLGGANASSTAAQQALGNAFNHDQCLAAKTLHIKVNPQYGTLDYTQLSVVPAADTLSAPEPGASPSPSSSAKPQLSPPC